jgi:transcriptional regulator with XRE-family HTH domain
VSTVAAARPAPPAPGAGVLGPQLRRLRLARAMTLDALAARVGLDKGYLSRLERGRKAPSIATLLRLSVALGAPVAELLGEALPEDAVHVTRAGRRRRGAADAAAHGLEMLTRGGAPLAASLVRPAGEFGADGAQDHAGEELVLVLEGAVELAFADRSFLLKVGDAADFPGHLPHRLRRAGTAPAVALVVVARGALG